MKNLILGIAMGLTIILALIGLGSCSWVMSATDSVVIPWIAPGDDGDVGTATTYVMKVAVDSAELVNNWTNQTEISGLPDPMIAGTLQSVVVVGLTTNTTYFFGMKAIDEAGNTSILSNIVRWRTPDFDSPSRITILQPHAE